MAEGRYVSVAMVARGRNSSHFGFWLVHQTITTVLDIPSIKLAPGVVPNAYDLSLLHTTPAYKYRLVVKSGNKNRDLMSGADILSRKITPHMHVGTHSTLKCYSALLEVDLTLLDKLRIALQSRQRWECKTHRHMLLTWGEMRQRRLTPGLYAALASQTDVKFCYVNDRCWRWCDVSAPFLDITTAGALPQAARFIKCSTLHFINL